MEDSNPSTQPTIHEVARRTVLRGGFAALLAPLAGVPPSLADQLTVPPGYSAQVLAAWGEPVGLADRAPAFRDDASNTAHDQEAQLGMHHDGMQFFALPGEGRGLLAINHEYHDDGLLHWMARAPGAPRRCARPRQRLACRSSRSCAVARAGAWCGRRRMRAASRLARRCALRAPPLATPCCRRLPTRRACTRSAPWPIAPAARPLGAPT